MFFYFLERESNLIGKRLDLSSCRLKARLFLSQENVQLHITTEKVVQIKSKYKDVFSAIIPIKKKYIEALTKIEKKSKCPFHKNVHNEFEDLFFYLKDTILMKELQVQKKVLTCKKKNIFVLFKVF